MGACIRGLKAHMYSVHRINTRETSGSQTLIHILISHTRPCTLKLKDIRYITLNYHKYFSITFHLGWSWQRGEKSIHILMFTD